MEDPPPYYRQHVFCCTNVRPDGHIRGSCGRRESERLRNYLKARVRERGLGSVRINSAGCLDRCALGPVMVIYPEGVWYTYRTNADVGEILQTHLIDGQWVQRLLLRPEDDPV